MNAKIFLASALTFLATISAAAIDFSKADAMFAKAEDLTGCRSVLIEQLPQASSDKEKAEVLWRLARVQVLIGEDETSKEGKRREFSKGISYAEKAIEADPQNHWGYMWHSANVGRECQTHPLMEQAKAVPVMLEDLDTILNTLDRTECGEAWQALAEIYYNHPFKSNDEALKYARNAVTYTPAGEVRTCAKTLLAKILYAKKQKDEARNVALKAKSEYEALPCPTPYQQKEYRELLEVIENIK